MNKKQLEHEIEILKYEKEFLTEKTKKQVEFIGNFQKTCEQLAKDALKMYRRIKYLEARDDVSTATINKLAAMLVDANRGIVSEMFDNLEPEEKEKITINANGTMTRVANG